MMQRLFKTLSFIWCHPLNQRGKIAAFKRFLRWQIGSRIVQGDVVYPWLNDLNVFVRLGETGFTGNIYAGLHEHEEMLFCLHTLKKGDLFVDVGANIGSYSLLLASLRGVSCIAFEPSDETYPRFMKNIRLNNLEGLITSHKCAVGGRNELIKFSKNFDTVNHVLAVNEVADDCIEVDGVTLDSIIGDLSTSVIKIDVEGYETLVISGAEKSLANENLLAVIMEVNGSGGRYGFDEDALLANMFNLGFKAYSYDPFIRKLNLLEDFSRKNGNIIFIRKIERVEHLINSASAILIHGQLV